MLNNITNRVRPAVHAVARRMTPLVRLITLGAIVGAAVAFASYQTFFVQPKVISPVGAALGVTEISNTRPVIIVFNHPISKKTLTYEIHPELKGSWRVINNVFSPRSQLTFTPSESPDLDTRYTIVLDGIKSIAGKQATKYLMSFQTDSLPTIKEINPADAAPDVLPDSPIILTADKAVPDGVILTASLTPELAFEPVVVSEKTITFSHKDPYQKGTPYALKVFLSTSKIDYATQATTITAEPTEILASTFTTLAAPGITSHSPTGSGLATTTTIQLEFQQPMDKVSTEAAFSIAPAVTGAITWESDIKMIFTPAQPLAKDQSYAVTLAKTAQAVSGFTFEESFTWSFTTLGGVTATLSPTSGATGVDTGTTISVNFNQEVNHASAESNFALAPTVVGSFTWEGNKMVFHPGAALASGQSYTVTIRQGVQSIQGTDLVSDISAKFTTKTQSVMLKVPAFAQAHMYSCMIAAARSALAYRGVTASESAIIAKVGKDTTAWSGTWGKDGAVWGDPETAMVGGLDNAPATAKSGSTSKVTWGYGSHWGPISKALTSYGVANEIRSGMSTKDLAQSLTDGNPIIIWWVNGIWPSYEVRWKTPSGKSIRGVNGLHVQVVRGFTGTVDSPQTFTVTDSGYGYPGRTLDVGTFKAKWAWFGNTGIIVK